MSDAAAFAPPRPAGYASAKKKRDRRKQTNKKGGCSATTVVEGRVAVSPQTKTVRPPPRPFERAAREKKRKSIAEVPSSGWVVLKTPILVSVVDFVFFFGSFLKKFTAFGLAFPLARQLEGGKRLSRTSFPSLGEGRSGCLAELLRKRWSRWTGACSTPHRS